MIPSGLMLADEEIIQTMIDLVRCSKSHRIIMTGSQSSKQMFELNRRGYARVATTASCGMPRGQYDVAFVDWQRQTIKALATILGWLVHFLAPTSVLVVSIDFSERTDRMKLKSLLERLGFRIEAG